MSPIASFATRRRWPYTRLTIARDTVTAENIAKGFDSVLYGFTAIAAFMIAYYLLFGVFSTLALGVNLLLLVALLVFGSGPIKGFAVVHCLGIITSIFSAVMVSRGIVNLIYGGKKKVAKVSIGNTDWHKKDAPA